MYLPDELPDARVLITVKTYPLPSSKYDELVCTAGVLPDGKWIRIYPIPFRGLSYDQKYTKYEWIALDLVRNDKNDFRMESYRPKKGLDENIRLISKIDTGKTRDWQQRKDCVLKEVFTSLSDLIQLSKGEGRKSLGVLKPIEIVDFVVERGEREWKKEWQDQFRQYNLFELDDEGKGKTRSIIRKVPYKYSYKFLSEGDTNPHKLMIEDWELGELYWKCLYRSGGDEKEANRLVRQKYYDEFVTKKDLYLFLGTTKVHHFSSSPFIVIGVFYPPKNEEKEAEQLSLF